jgi:solute carrier family 10 (sodium/bile acid cotransporter), member 7
MKIDKFVLSMLLAILVSFFIPWLGAKNSPLHLGLVTKWGVALVFFLHGANLSFKAISQGAANFRLHIFIQGTTFIIYPIIGFLIYFGLAGILSDTIRLGLFYLCALSSTISSSVTMTAIGKGNVAGAVFDASISGILGMIITPFLVSIILTGKEIGHFNLGQAMIDIAKTLLLPFVIGHFSRPILKNILINHKKIISLIDKSVIVLIVFVAFCNSNIEKIWTKIPILELGILIITICCLLAFILFFTNKMAKIFGFNHGDKVAGVFCATTKSLANGAPIAAILFAGNPMMGLIILPIMIYHQLQLIICSFLAGKWGK